MKSLNKIAALITMLIISTSIIFSQGISVNTDGAAADASAMMDIQSTEGGLLIPRMTNDQKNAIGSPATGLMVYQTDGVPGFYYFDGSLWTLLKNETDAPYTIKGSMQITGAGTYIIDYGNDLRGSAWISCSIDQVICGIWNAGGTIIFSENDNTKDYLVNIAKYQYDDNQIQADLQPYGGTNTLGVADYSGGKVQVNVAAISGQSWLRWSVTVFPAD